MSTLKIKVLDSGLLSLYQKRVNVKGDAGVDLYFPEEVVIEGNSLGTLVDLQIQGEMVQEVNTKLTDNIPVEMLGNLDIRDRPLSYKVLPRSSIYKTPLRMSNGVGIMDSGYRGNFKVPIDNMSKEDFIIEKHTRLFQVVGPILESIKLKVVGELSDSTRGSGGFGSTGV